APMGMSDFTPLANADLSQVQAVFTDVDGTLTTEGRIRASTLAALERLGEAGVRVVLVTGRPAGWGECWARNLPVEGVIAENGGLYFAPDKKGRLKRFYPQPAAERARSRRQLQKVVQKVLGEVKGAQL